MLAGRGLTAPPLLRPPQRDSIVAGPSSPFHFVPPSFILGLALDGAVTPGTLGLLSSQTLPPRVPYRAVRRVRYGRKGTLTSLVPSDRSPSVAHSPPLAAFPTFDIDSASDSPAAAADPFDFPDSLFDAATSPQRRSVESRSASGSVLLPRPASDPLLPPPAKGVTFDPGFRELIPELDLSFVRLFRPGPGDRDAHTRSGARAAEWEAYNHRLRQRREHRSHGRDRHRHRENNGSPAPGDPQRDTDAAGNGADAVAADGAGPAVAKGPVRRVARRESRPVSPPSPGPEGNRRPQLPFFQLRERYLQQLAQRRLVDEYERRQRALACFTWETHPRLRHPDRVYPSAVVYDNEAYLFGGLCKTDQVRFLADFLKFNTASGWTALESINTPRGREGHAAVVTQEGLLVVFGGMTDAGMLNDTHAVDLNLLPLTWRRLRADRAPAARTGHSAVLHANRWVVVFGGRSARRLLNDCWQFDLTTGVWTELALAHAPVPRTRHACALHGNLMYIFGGSTSLGSPAEASVLSRGPSRGTADGEAEKEPGKRPASSATASSAAGSESAPMEVRWRELDDLCSLDLPLALGLTPVEAGEATDGAAVGAAWHAVRWFGEEHPGRRHSATLVASHNRLLLYGGCYTPLHQHTTRTLDEVHCFDIAVRCWRTFEAPSLGARWGHRAALVRSQTSDVVMLALGGVSTPPTAYHLVALTPALQAQPSLVDRVVGCALAPGEAPDGMPRAASGWTETEEERQLQAEFLGGSHFAVQVDRHYALGEFATNDLIATLEEEKAAVVQQVKEELAVKYGRRPTSIPATAHGDDPGLLKGRGSVVRCERPCEICGERAASAYFTPCGHTVACDDCAPRFVGQPCPCCRRPIEDATAGFSSSYDLLRTMQLAATPDRPYPNPTSPWSPPMGEAVEQPTASPDLATKEERSRSPALAVVTTPSSEAISPLLQASALLLTPTSPVGTMPDLGTPDTAPLPPSRSSSSACAEASWQGSPYLRHLKRRLETRPVRRSLWLR